MNLTFVRSGELVFLNVEYIKGYAFKTAAARVKSALLQVNGVNRAVFGSSFTQEFMPQ